MCAEKKRFCFALFVYFAVKSADNYIHFYIFSGARGHEPEAADMNQRLSAGICAK
jgi:hypothetical protein